MSSSVAPAAKQFWIGTSGWSYDHWTDVLYPPGLPVGERLACYVKHFHSVEINSPFYRWPGESAFERWQQRLPPDFQMSVKAPRGLTHGARLYAPERWLMRILPGLRALGERLGVLLVQLPPQMECDLPRLEYFLRRLPPGLRTAVELRHPSWNREETYALLETCGAAYCVMSGAGLPCVLRATAPFVYVRLHGPDPEYLYAGSYSDDSLRWWTERLREWQGSGRDVYAYFNNDGFGHAVRNAERLESLLFSSS